MSVLAEGLFTQVEWELLRAFRKTDARGKRSILFCAEGQAEDWPAQRPNITLVPNCGPKPPATRGKSKG